MTSHRTQARLPRAEWLDAGLVALVALITSANILVNDYAVDDLPLIVGDDRVHALGMWKLYFTKPYWPPPFSPDLYRPFSTTLFALEYGLGGGTPVVFRLVSILLYIAVSFAVVHLVRQFMDERPALAVGLLFAAAPIHTEALALAVNQSELLVTILAVGSVLVYLRARNPGPHSAGALGRWGAGALGRWGAGALGAGALGRWGAGALGGALGRWGALVLMYAAACLIKETGFVIIALLAIAELLIVRRAQPRADSKSPLAGFGVLAVVAAAILVVRRLVLHKGIAGSFTAEALVGASARERALTMLQVVPRWLRLFVWPVHLQADYSPGEIVKSTHLGSTELVGLGIVIAVIALIVLSWRKLPAVSFGLLWCAIALAPVSNVVIPTGIVLAERTLFLPSVGFLIAVIALGGAAVTQLAKTRDDVPRYAELAVLVIVVLWAWRSVRREFDWRNNAILWLRTAQDAPRSYRAQHAVGFMLFQIGRTPEAIEAYQRAIDESPNPEWIRNDLANQFRDHGNDSLALLQFEASLRRDPNQPVAKAGLIADLIALGRYDDAKREAQDAVARGLSASVATGLAAVADSAERAHAPAGSVRLRLKTSIRPYGF